MTAAIFAFSESVLAARALADALAIPCHDVAVHRFPDGESRVRVAGQADRAIVYRSLDHPNDRLVELLLAASALRDGGSRSILLVAPYLGYMRQDIAFHPGEAVSQRVVGRLIADWFDGLVTVDPHLHRTPTLDIVVPGRSALLVSGAQILAAMLRADISRDAVIVGPDAESRAWVAQVADALGLEMLIGEKERLGDRSVTIRLPDAARVAGRPVVLVDDVVSSGQTLIDCARLLHAAGARSIEAAATHCLADAADRARLEAAGITRLRTTDTISGPTAAVSVAPALAAALRQSGLLG